MALALAAIAVAVALAAGDDERLTLSDTWHKSIDPALCDSDATVEYPSSSRWIEHSMVPGETIEEIAARYGLREMDLRAHNNLEPTTMTLRKGARLHVKARRVPQPRSLLELEIGEGETWRGLARRHGVDSKELRAYNWPWKDKLVPGSKVSVWADPLTVDWIGGAGADEIVARGGLGVGAPDAGHLIGGVAVPEGEGYALRFPESSYGTTHSVSELLRALQVYRATTKYTRTLQLGAMSRPRGGPLGGHRSHQTGRDIDILLPRRADVPSYLPLTPRRMDWLALWDLALAFSTVDAAVIYLDYKLQRDLYRAVKAAGMDPDDIARVLQYPRGSAARRGLIRHEPGHTAHMHVRFGCGPCEVECIELGAWAQ